MELIYSANTWPALVVGLLLGATIGSFLNVVITRLPKQLQQQWQRDCAELQGKTPPEQPRFNLAYPASHCPRCQAAIRWYDNIPLVSYLLLWGRCRHCHQPIGVTYWLVEAVMTVIAGLAAWQLGLSMSWLVLLATTALLLSMVVIDYQHKLLPDQLTYPLLWLGLLWATTEAATITPSNAIVGALVGYLSLWSIYWLFKWLTGKEGLGYGDFKLLAAIGAFTGPTVLPVTVLASSLVGIVVGVISLVRKGRSEPIPFGPFLIGGGIISYIWGHELLFSYWHWLGG